MSYPINYPTPQGANIQIFRGRDDSGTAHVATRDWVKPQGASFVFFTLIGAGGGGGGSALESTGPTLYFGGGGASGNVTKFMCPAFLLPDILQVAVGKGGNGASSVTNAIANNGDDGTSTQIIYQQKDGTGYQLLLASGGGGGGGANAFSTYSNGIGGSSPGLPDAGGPMTAAGIYQSLDNQPGANGGNQVSTGGTKFVMGGNGYTYSAGTTTGYYGYVGSTNNGYSQISPIIMAISGSPAVSNNTKQVAAAFGCGGNGGGDFSAQTNSYGSRGGDGLAIIVTW